LPLLLSVDDASRQGVGSRRQVRKLIADGTLDAVKAGRRTMIRGESVHRYVNSLPAYKPLRVRGLKGHGEVADHADPEAEALELARQDDENSAAE
jgi:excisionase family DNA binding protein